MTISVLVVSPVRSDEGQVSLLLHPGYSLFAANAVYRFNNGPAIDMGIGYAVSDESTVGFVLGYDRFAGTADNAAAMNLYRTGVTVKRYLNDGISEGYLTGGLDLDYAHFSGTPSPSSDGTGPPDDAGLGFNTGVGVDIAASPGFFFGPVLSYEGIILQRAYVSLITIRLSLGLLF